MSTQEQPSEAAEPPVKTWDVELSIEGSAWITVEAEDEDEAHDAAIDMFHRTRLPGDIEVQSVRVEDCQEVGS